MSKTIALLIDHSGSMGPSGYGYLEYAKSDAAAFVNIMHKGDDCAVVEFSDNADVVQPLTPLTDQSVADAVCRKILAITAANLTNIGDGIVKSKEQIGSAQAPKGIVLLTDGEWNVPPDPLTVLPSYPIYTIALGNSQAIPTMQAIAERTGGTYHFAPGYRELQRIYNEIAQDSTIADTITNDLESVNPYNYRETTVTFSPGVDSGKIVVSWDDTGVTYTPNTPVGNQVNVSITDPSGQAFTAAPVFVGPAGIVFSVPNPAPGVWTIGCWYAGQVGGRQLGCVWGGFEPYGTVMLDVNAERGASGDIDISFSDEGGSIANTCVRATLETPLMTLANAVKAIPGAPPAAAAGNEDEINEDLAKAAAAERETGRPTVPVSCVPLRAVSNGNGLYRITLPNTDIPAYAALHVVAEGISQKTGQPVKRTRHLTLTAK